MNTNPETVAFPLDHLAIGRDPDADALVTRSGTLSYKMLNHRIGALAAWLRDQGAVKGDRIATWLSKTELACLMPLAAARAGLVHVPVNPLLKQAQVGYIVEDSGARLLIGNAGRLKTLEDSSIGTHCNLFEDKNVEDALTSVVTPLAPSPANTDIHDLAAILYTSGSTGRPKGVMLSHANLTLGALSVAEYLKLAADDRTICVLPLSFDYGQNQLLSTWAAGGCAVPLDYLTPRDVLKTCARERITTLAAVPPLWVQLVEHDWPAEAVDSMRRLTNSGGALTPTLVRQLRAIFGQGTDIYAMYGLTEAFRSTYLDPTLIDENPTSMGSAIPFAEILVVDETGQIAGPDEAGELVHCGPLVAQGYWKDAERTAQRFKSAPAISRYSGTAVFSGDTVKRGEDGLLYFVSRDDAMIKSSGNRISPTEIEEIAIESGMIAEAVALGVPDVRLGHAIRLFVRAVDSGSEDETVTERLANYLKQNLPNFMHPRDIILLSELPKNPNGKLDRNLLASMDVG